MNVYYAYCKCYHFGYEYYNTNRCSLNDSSLLWMFPRDDKPSKNNIHPESLPGRNLEGTTHLIGITMKTYICEKRLLYKMPLHVIAHLILIKSVNYEAQAFLLSFSQWEY